MVSNDQIRSRYIYSEVGGCGFADSTLSPPNLIGISHW